MVDHRATICQWGQFPNDSPRNVNARAVGVWTRSLATRPDDVRMKRRTFLLLVLLVLIGSTTRTFAQDTFEGVERIVAVGDVHSDYDRLVDVLRTADLVDGRNAWIGGKAHLVLVGDFIDRGPASAKVMDLLMALDPQAEHTGGKVHALIGNHEAMNVYGDLRYVSKDDYKTYRAMAPDLQDLKKTSALVPEAPFLRGLQAGRPQGWEEQRLLFGPEGRYGRWMRRQNAIVRINDLLFLHGGISPRYASTTREEINREIRAELQDFSKLPRGMALDEDGPLWYRGLAQLPENSKGLADHIDRVLATHSVRHVVIGHTRTLAVLPRFDGKVILVDVGLSKVYGGPPAFLLVENSKYYAVHRGRQLDLPAEGGDLLPYLRNASILEPSSSPLRRLVARARP